MKRMRWVGTLLWVLPTFFLFAQPQAHQGGIRWMSWDEGYAKALKEGKVLMVHSYTDWCGWCKRMEKTTFQDPEVVAFVNREMIAVKLNPEKQGQYDVGNGKKVDGRTLLRMLSNNQRSGYPTHFFLLPGKRQIFREPGYRAPQDFLQVLKRYVALNKKTETRPSDAAQ